MDENTVPDLYRLAFCPGQFRCPMCDFQLTRRTLSAPTGQVGTVEKDRESEPCPNDGTMMVHVTYKEMLESYDKRLREEFDRVEKFVKLLRGASHGLRSYQFGNSSPDLAASMADAIDKAVANERAE